MSSTQQPLEYGAPISLELAKQVAAAAEAEARANAWPMVIAVVDAGGHLVVLHKLDHAQLGGVEIAQSKTRTAAHFKRPTKAFENALAAGGLGLRLLSTTSICPLEAGLPLVANGKVIGAIGVSGMQPNQDAHVAATGASVIEG